MSYRSLPLIPALSDNLLSDRFSQIDRLFSRLTGEKPLSDVPAYNLVRKDKTHHELTVSVPGYKKEELEISVINNQLLITGWCEVEKNEESNNKDNAEWLHKGIEKKSFTMSFNLDHRIKIENANLDEGLLTLEFTYDIPDEEKPKKIAITQNTKASEHNK